MTEESQVLFAGQVGIDSQILRDEADGRAAPCRSGGYRLPGNRDRAVVGFEKTTDNGDRGGLPGSVGAEQAKRLPCRDGEADAVDRGQIAESLDQ
jgi:hypothetical protein